MIRFTGFTKEYILEQIDLFLLFIFELQNHIHLETLYKNKEIYNFHVSSSFMTLL